MASREERLSAARRHLASKGRRRYVSISALSELIKEFKEDGLPERHTRQAIKRARDTFGETDTDYGFLFCTLPIELCEPPEVHDLLYVNPFAMVAVAAREGIGRGVPGPSSLFSRAMRTSFKRISIL